VLDLPVPGTAHGSRYFPTVEISIVAMKPHFAFSLPDPLVCAASLPFVLTPLAWISHGAVPVGVRRSGAAIFEPVSICR